MYLCEGGSQFPLGQFQGAEEPNEANPIGADIIRQRQTLTTAVNLVAHILRLPAEKARVDGDGAVIRVSASQASQQSLDLAQCA